MRRTRELGFSTGLRNHHLRAILGVRDRADCGCSEGYCYLGNSNSRGRLPTVKTGDLDAWNIQNNTCWDMVYACLKHVFDNVATGTVSPVLGSGSQWTLEDAGDKARPEELHSDFIVHEAWKRGGANFAWKIGQSFVFYLPNPPSVGRGPRRKRVAFSHKK